MSVWTPFLQMLAYNVSYFALLLLDGARRVDYRQSELGDHSFIFCENLTLKAGEALLRIVTPTHVPSRLVQLQFPFPGDYAVDGYIQGNPEEESDGGLNRELVNFAHPRGVAAACDVAGK